MSGAGEPPATRAATWRAGRGHRWLARLAYPVIWALNRPGFARFGDLALDVALRINGIAINFEGRHGLGIAEERFLERLAPRLDGGAVFDVGANNGAYAAHVRRVAPGAAVTAFEPHPRSFAALARRLEGQGIALENLALGEREATLELHDFADADGSTQASLDRAAVALYTDRIVSHRVRCTTVDALLAARGIARLALLKVDTEGHDLQVLRGAREAIAARRIEAIQFEFIPANIATGVRMRDFFEVLAPGGYALHRLCLNGELTPLGAYDVKRHEIYVTQILVALPA